MEIQQQLFPIEILEAWRFATDLPENVAELAESYITNSIMQRVARRGYGIFISHVSLELFAEGSGRCYLEEKLGVDPDRYGEQLVPIVGAIDQKMADLTRITPHELDVWKTAHNL